MRNRTAAPQWTPQFHACGWSSKWHLVRWYRGKFERLTIKTNDWRNGLFLDFNSEAEASEHADRLSNAVPSDSDFESALGPCGK